jgi:hypothetical protein
MTRSFKWSLPFRFSDKNFVYISYMTHACYMAYPPYSSCFALLKCTSYEVPHCTAFFSLLPLPCRFSYSPEHPFSDTRDLQYALLLFWETKFHTHTRQWVNVLHNTYSSSRYIFTVRNYK